MMQFYEVVSEPLNGGRRITRHAFFLSAWLAARDASQHGDATEIQRLASIHDTEPVVYAIGDNAYPQVV